jgi:phosphopantetheine binding protein/AMP-binding enzyme
VTAEKFIPHPFSTEPGARLYRTGDRARYLRDGQLEFLGRADEQVKIRGFRIELGEIEAALAQHPNVAETVVTVFEDQPGNKRLAAHVILKQPATSSSQQLRSFLKERLPDFMAPAYIVPLEAWPLTANGKLDRRSLVIPDHERPDHASEFVAPQTADEKMLAAIWADLLGFEQVGVHDNFFDSGGHSLLATQLASRVRTAFQLELPLRAIFESPTISTLVEKIAAIRWQQETLAEFSAVSHGARETGEL